MATATVWLSEHEERVWRDWLRLNAELTAALQRQLQAEAGLSMSDYEVLVDLTDDPAGRIRVAELAALLQWERSRVSHHVTRMERRGLVEREECADDGRGAFVAITPAGRAAIEQAAPGHAQAVRRLVFDPLQVDEMRSLEAVIDKLLAQRNRGPGTTALPGHG
jgi:DNA-binding MarR family transcriptional regulator